MGGTNFCRPVHTLKSMYMNVVGVTVAVFNSVCSHVQCICGPQDKGGD